MKGLRHDGVLWRRLAHYGAAEGPTWWLKYSPPAFGVAAAALVPSARRAVQRNLQKARGDASTFRNAVDVCRTFSTYACALAESLALGSKNHVVPKAEVEGAELIVEAASKGRGVIFVTAHTAGWDVAGTLLGAHLNMSIAIVMQSERDAGARAIHDAGRTQVGIKIVHADDDPISSIGLLHHLRDGGAAAMQIDRVPAGMRKRKVWLLGEEGAIPEGPLRLAQLTGAPIVPLFCARLGFRHYVLRATRSLYVPRKASDGELTQTAQLLADDVTDFIRSHPTQWLNFS